MLQSYLLYWPKKDVKLLGVLTLRYRNKPVSEHTYLAKSCSVIIFLRELLIPMYLIPGNIKKTTLRLDLLYQDFCNNSVFPFKFFLFHSISVHTNNENCLYFQICLIFSFLIYVDLKETYYFHDYIGFFFSKCYNILLDFDLTEMFKNLINKGLSGTRLIFSFNLENSCTLRRYVVEFWAYKRMQQKATQIGYRNPP